jgi:2',3'-cyclic-nucleotide 2'-phosphodiesterase/3'-nucleotidase
MEAIGFQGTAEFITPATQRNLILDQVLSRPTLNPAPTNTWRTVPYLDRERVLNLAK